MGEVIKFPIIEKPPVSGVVSEDTNNPASSNVLYFREKFAAEDAKVCFFEGNPRIAVGGEIIVRVSGKRYKGIVTNIVQRDENNNITKIAYNIPFLNGDDPLKFGEADFTYKTEAYD